MSTRFTLVRKWFPSAAVWTAIFTGVLTVFTYLEYRVSKDSGDLQKSSQKAYLSFAGPQLGSRMVAGDPSDQGAPWIGQEISQFWSNNGETPAVDVVVQTGYGAYSPDIPNSFDFPLTSDKVHAVIGPKSVYGTPVQLPTDQIMDAWLGKRRVFIWGDAMYKDVFGISRNRLSEFWAIIYLIDRK